MKYAPILIPTLCRYEHFVRCIESLKRNTWAQYTDVYVAIDYPAKEEHWNGYKKICEYLEGAFEEFNQFIVFKREYNFGAAKNMMDLRSYVLEHYDSFIRTDDDCEFSPNFIEYMDKCMDFYKDDMKVLGVTGYSYPIKWDISEKYNAFKSSLIFPMWGTGFWKDKFLKMQQDIISGYVKDAFKKNRYSKKNMTDARYIDCLCGIFNDEHDLINCFSDVSCGCYLQLTESYIITPVVSKVRNYGFDGTGEYCQDTQSNKEESNATDYNYRLQAIDQSNSYELNVEETYNYLSNYKLLNNFDKRSSKQIFITRCKCFIKYLLIKLLGMPKYKKILRKSKFVI